MYWQVWPNTIPAVVLRCSLSYSSSTPGHEAKPRAISRRTVANCSHGSFTPTVVLTEPSPVLATAYGSEPLQRSSDRLEGSIIVPVACYGGPGEAVPRLCMSKRPLGGRFPLAQSLAGSSPCGNGNVSAEGLWSFQ